MERERRGWSRRRRENVPGGRQHSHHVRVSPEEEAVLLVRANELGMSVSRLLAESALSGSAQVVAERERERSEALELHVELRRLQRLIGAAGVNLNQIAKGVNSGAAVDESLEPLLGFFRRVLSQAQDVYERIGAPR